MSGLGQLKLQGQGALGRGTPEASQDAYREAVKDALLTKFGFSEFRGRQEEAVLGILSGRDVFVLMPTGGGKSLCYGLPPLVKPGVAVVVSPLIALMQDQVRSFEAKGIDARLLSSAQPTSQRQAVLADLRSRRPMTQLLFVTPELLDTEAFMATLRWMYSSGSLLMVAVDEAHCISSYGHDFRPAYRRLGAVRRELQGLPIMALTATATARVQDDICQQLRLQDPLRLASTFNRPNIAYEVRYVELLKQPGAEEPPEDPLTDLAALLRRERQATGSGGRVPCTVIYTHKRESADDVARALSAQGIPCRAYHAGMQDSQRSEVLSAFSRGELDVVAATVAFGMGIDRADVRMVVHYNLPKSVEGFYQESGRAGRDDKPSKSILYYSARDRNTMAFVLGPDAGRKRKQQQSPQDQQWAAEKAKKQLADFGQVVAYALSSRCRRAVLLAHFGERAPPSGGTGCCDACAEPARVAAAVQQVQALGVQRQQEFQGRRLAFPGQGGKGNRSSAGAGAMEFELDRPGEGLDFDTDGAPASFFEEEDGIQASDDDEDEGAALAQAAAKRARQVGARGAERILSALEAAEQRYERREASALAGQSSKSRLLAKLEAPAGGSDVSARSNGSGSVPDSLRENARRQLARTLAGNACLAPALSGDAVGGAGDGSGSASGCSGAERLQQAAAALEQHCYQGVQSKPVYQSKLSNLNLLLKRAQQLGDVPQLAALWPAGAPEAWAQQQPPAAGARLPAPQPPQQQQQQQGPQQVEEQQRGKQQGGKQQQAGRQWQEAVAVASLRSLMGELQQAAGSCGAGEAPAAEAAGRAVRLLQQLARMGVSGGLLLETGAGKQVRALRRHAHAAVAAAAGEVFEVWKAAVLAEAPGQ